MRFLPAACLAAALALPISAQAEGKSIIVLDASGSMWGQIDGRAKLEIAREALGSVLSGLDPATEIGLIAYGHREKGSCEDIELVVPPAAGTGQAIIDAANAMKFLGKTPLTEAVRRAAGDLKSSEEKATVILITDGIETCEADPCALGAELEASGVDFTAHVVGFGLTEDEGKAVACLAENTGGKYIQASDAGALVEALKTTVVVAEPEPVPEPEPAPAPVAAVEFNLMPTAVYAAEGDPVPAEEGMAWEVHLINADGTTGERLTTEYGDPKLKLDPGTYRLIGKLGEAIAELDVAVAADATATPVLNLNAGRVLLHPKLDAAAPVDDGAAVQMTLPSGDTATYYGDTDTVVPAGDLPVRVTIGNAVAEVVVSVVAGNTTEMDIVAQAGLAAIEGFYTPEMMIEGGAHAVVVYPAKVALDGSRERIETIYGAGAQSTLPPGDYVAEVSLDLAVAETPFTIKGGERTDVKVVLDAGVMAITAPEGSQTVVLPGKADISGNRERLYTGYSAETTLTAPAGDYLVQVTMGETTTEVTLTVTSGERTEVSVP
jgi:Ca-activated chloride channel family protein